MLHFRYIATCSAVYMPFVEVCFENEVASLGLVLDFEELEHWPYNAHGSPASNWICWNIGPPISGRHYYLYIDYSLTWSNFWMEECGRSCWLVGLLFSLRILKSLYIRCQSCILKTQNLKDITESVEMTTSEFIEMQSWCDADNGRVDGWSQSV